MDNRTLEYIIGILLLVILFICVLWQADKKQAEYELSGQTHNYPSSIEGPDPY